MTLASWITSVRFVLAPLIYWQLMNRTTSGLLWALLLLLLAGLSDILDGWVARSRNEISELGKTLDPLTDKTVIFSVLLPLAQAWGLPVWLVVFYGIKELFQILAGFFLLREYKQLISANQWGKASTFGFFCGIGLFLIQKPQKIIVFTKPLGVTVITIALLLSVFALYTYYLDYKVLTKKTVKQQNSR